jgi:hypothetical protein
MGNVSMEWPGRLDAEPGKQLQQTRTADLAGKKTARDIVGGVLAAIRAEPACDRIDIDPEPAQDLLRHRPSHRQ